MIEFLIRREPAWRRSDPVAPVSLSRLSATLQALAVLAVVLRPLFAMLASIPFS